MTTKTVHFTIDPGFLVEEARGHVLSEDWRGGLSLLVDGLEGMTLDLAVQILKGELTLREESEGLSTVPQDPTDKELKRYLSTAAWQSAGIYQERGEFYQPYALIAGFDRDDRQFAKDYQARMPDDSLTMAEYRVLRARYHMHNRESDLVFFDLHEKAVLFKRVQGPAFWVDTHKDAKAALAAFLAQRGLSRHGTAAWDGNGYFQPNRWEFYEDAIREGLVYAGNCTDTFLEQRQQEVLHRLSELAEAIVMARIADDEYQAEAEKRNAEKPRARFFRTRTSTQDAVDAYDAEVLRERITEQAMGSGGFLELLVVDKEAGDKVLRVPATPFLLWASRHAGYDAREGIAPWKPISPSGLKMAGDNPFHTDWWVGSGLPVGEAYNQEHPVNRAAWRFATGLGRNEGHDCVRLAGEGIVFGRVVFPKPNEAVPEGSIAVVPYAGVDYEIAMLSACKGGRGAVVSAVGGKLAHLATVARETSCRVLVMDEAMEAFQEGQFVTINLDRLKVTRHETFLSTPDPFGR